MTCSEALSEQVLSAFKFGNIVSVVPDHYDIELSIKSDERKRRSKTHVAERKIISGETKLPSNMQVFLMNLKNKIHILNFILDDWMKRFQTLLRENQQLALLNETISDTTSRKSTALLNGNTVVVGGGMTMDPNIVSDHEEADRKMFVYAKYHADHGAKRIIIASPDTDVAFLCCHHFHLSLRSCDQLWLRTGTGSNRRFIPIHDICAKRGSELCKLLPGFHSLTGCDSTGSFSGIVKKRAFKVLQKHGQDVPNLALLGSQPIINEDLPLVAACTEFVCRLYDDKGETTDVNDLRYQLFCQKQLSGEKLPPTSDALACHVKRADYQCFIWKQACKGKLELPSPVENGWRLEDGVLVQELMTEPPAPEV